MTETFFRNKLLSLHILIFKNLFILGGVVLNHQHMGCYQTATSQAEHGDAHSEQLTLHGEMLPSMGMTSRGSELVYSQGQEYYLQDPRTQVLAAPEAYYISEKHAPQIDSEYLTPAAHYNHQGTSILQPATSASSLSPAIEGHNKPLDLVQVAAQVSDLNLPLEDAVENLPQKLMTSESLAAETMSTPSAEILANINGGTNSNDSNECSVDLRLNNCLDDDGNDSDNDITSCEQVSDNNTMPTIETSTA